MTKLALALGMMATVLLVVGAIASFNSDDASAGAAGGMAAMSFDMDPTGNTATSLGDRQECFEVSAGDEVEIDITALDIPESNPILAFQAKVLHDADYISVTGSDVDFLLAVLPGSNLLDASAAGDDPGVYLSVASDLNPAASESGSGVLSRLTIAVDEDTPAGGYPLILDPDDTGHVDDQSVGQEPLALNHGQLAVDVDCDSLPPPGIFEFARGDNDCNGGVDAVDGLKGLQHVAALDFSQEPGCPPLGSEVGSIIGDVDCNDAVDAVDALKILRHVAALEVSQTQPCTKIGEPF